MAPTKIGPKEAAARAQRELRAAEAAKAQRTKVKAKGIGKLTTIKASRRGK